MLKNACRRFPEVFMGVLMVAFLGLMWLAYAVFAPPATPAAAKPAPPRYAYLLTLDVGYPPVKGWPAVHTSTWNWQVTRPAPIASLDDVKAVERALEKQPALRAGIPKWSAPNVVITNVVPLPVNAPPPAPGDAPCH